MGFDSFGLPLVIRCQNRKTSQKNNRRKCCQFKNQLDKLGLSFDWDREIKTSDSSYYRWTQWIF